MAEDQSSVLKIVLLVATVSILAYFTITTEHTVHFYVYAVYAVGAIAYFLWDRFTLKSNLFINVGVYSVTILAGMATYKSWWSEIPYYDKIIHFFIHFLVGMIAIRLWKRWIPDNRYAVLAAMGTVILFGYIIELYEYALWSYLGLNMAEGGLFYRDTMDDFLFDIAGGSVGVILGLSSKQTRET